MSSAALSGSVLPRHRCGLGVASATNKKRHPVGVGGSANAKKKTTRGAARGGETRVSAAQSSDDVVPRGEATAILTSAFSHHRRRDFLVAATTALFTSAVSVDAALADDPNATATPLLLSVGTGETYATINAAVTAAAAANAAATTTTPIIVRVSPGKYLERVVVPAELAGVLTVEAAPG